MIANSDEEANQGQSTGSAFALATVLCSGYDTMSGELNDETLSLLLSGDSTRAGLNESRRFARIAHAVVSRCPVAWAENVYCFMGISRR